MEFTLFLKVLQRKNYLVMEDIKLLAFVILTLYFWFETDVVFEYAALIGVNLRKNYEEYKEKYPIEISYPEYLSIKKNTFLFKLLGCSICFSVWLNLILGFNVGFSLVGVNIILTWVIYFSLVKLIKFLNR